MTHEELVEKARAALRAVFSDTSVSRGKTYTALSDLGLEIDIMLEALDDDVD